jgi:hypothetical protein
LCHSQSFVFSLRRQAAVLRSTSNAKQQADVHLLIFETEVTTDGGDAPAHQLLQQASAISGLQATLVGQGQKFNGFGSKYEAVLPILHTLPSDTIVVLSDARDVLINIHSANSVAEEAMQGFRDAFSAVTFQQPGAIVISAEAQCCVSALTYVQPGDYFDTESGKRNQRACSSGEADCLWNGDEYAEPWQSFMKDVAFQRMGNAASVLDDIYLNAGLIVGKAADLLRVLDAADILATEDDQAVLTDYMFRNPQDILLDYGQSMFGNNRGGLEGQESCMFQMQAQRLSHIKTDSTPLFVHSPGGFLQCHDDLAEQLGWKAVSPKTRRRLTQWRDGVQNYKYCPWGQKLVSGYCVKECCRSDYQCPANSVRIQGRDCYDGFEDCQCQAGFRAQNNACVPVTTPSSTTCFKCPMYSSSRSCNNNGYQCKNTMDDCTCDWGYKNLSGFCVKSWCNADFSCPSGKRRIPGRDCYDNIYDCQ